MLIWRTPLESPARSFLTELDTYWTSRLEQESRGDLMVYIERGQLCFQQGKLSSAELFFRHVAESAPESDAAKVALQFLSRIESRRKSEVRIQLQ